MECKNPISLIPLRLVCLGLMLLIMVTESAQDWQQDGLNLHNKYRGNHNAPKLTLSSELHRSAQKCADYLARIKKMEHVCKNKFGFRYGENLATIGSGHDRRSAAVDATKRWYGEEVGLHNFKKNAFQYPSGHFSQVVWKKTRKVGFGYAQNGNFRILVAHYDPTGNMQGDFLKNVQRAG